MEKTNQITLFMRCLAYATLKFVYDIKLWQTLGQSALVTL